MPAALPLLAAAGSVGAGMAAVGGTMAGFMGATLGTQLIAGALIAGGALTAVGDWLPDWASTLTGRAERPTLAIGDLDDAGYDVVKMENSTQSVDEMRAQSRAARK